MTDDMDHPVTRRELREELANHPTRQELREELANHPTRQELHEALAVWAGALEERIVTGVTAQITAHTTAEIARHMTASEERIRADMRAMLDPHQGVPERVTGLEARVERLETKALAPKRARRRRPR